MLKARRNLNQKSIFQSQTEKLDRSKIDILKSAKRNLNKKSIIL